MKTTKEKTVSFGLLFAGFVFLANPYIDLFDFLPDCIGYLFIYLAISPLTRLNDSLAVASEKLFYLFLLSLGRFVAFVLSVSSETTTILTLTFIFGIAEIVLALVFFADFFGGLEYLLQRHGSYTALSNMGSLKFLTTLFFIVKITLNVLPNLVAIAEVEARVSISASQALLDIVDLKPYALALFFIVTLIFGAWWLREARRHFSVIKTDADFLSKLMARHDRETAYENKKTVLKKLRRAFIFLSLGWFFLLDITISGISIFPDMAATLFIWAGIGLLKKTKEEKTRLGPLAAAALGLQTAYAICFKFFAMPGAVLADFPLQNAIILAGVAACFASVSFIFVARGLHILAVFLQGPGKAPLKKTGTRLLLLYAVYLMLTVAGAVLPVAYTALLFPRILTIGFFIVFAIARHYAAFDEYADTVA